MAGKRRARKSVPFGGRWTEAKLGVLRKYLSAYTTALKKQPFEKVYIDAFAGTGYREAEHEHEGGQKSLLPESESEQQEFLEGSAAIALRTEPRFDRYIFIEKSPARCHALLALKEEHPSKADDIEIVEGDANEEIRKLCSEDWALRRAVLFLDPFGMQVEWRTVEAIARTQAVDLWYLFPLAVVRLLDPDGHIRPEWRPALDRTMPAGWFDRLYRKDVQPTLFETDAQHTRAHPLAIGEYLLEQMRAIFAGVAPRPAVLENSKGSPLYLLCFAAANKAGAPIATRIANDLLRGLP